MPDILEVGPSRPDVYWDRATQVVRDWNTDQALPEYQGPCLVDLDIQGPVFLRTFLHDGKRCWEQDSIS
jgi:hypothetical protein